jgi:uncharacterized protein YdeI (YjbR/CyaY-like superfamily)
LDALELPDGAAWEAWLAERHDEHREAWLRIAKRHSGIALITLPEALDGALCFGWVDDHRSPAQTCSTQARTKLLDRAVRGLDRTPRSDHR